MSCGTSLTASAWPTATAAACRKFSTASGLGWRAWLAFCLERGKQRHGLSELDAHLLEDIGLSRLQALQEAGKPAWRD